MPVVLQVRHSLLMLRIHVRYDLSHHINVGAKLATFAIQFGSTKLQFRRRLSYLRLYHCGSYDSTFTYTKFRRHYKPTDKYAFTYRSWLFCLPLLLKEPPIVIRWRRRKNTAMFLGWSLGCFQHQLVMLGLLDNASPHSVSFDNCAHRRQIHNIILSSEFVIDERRSNLEISTTLWIRAISVNFDKT